MNLNEVKNWVEFCCRHRLRALAIAFAFSSISSSATDRYWSGNSGSSWNIDQDGNWFNTHPSSGDNLYFNNTGGNCGASGIKTPWCNYGTGAYFGDLITFGCSGGITWEGDQTYLYKFENQDTVQLSALATLANRTGPDADIQINPVNGPVIVNNVVLQNGKQLQVFGGNSLTITGVVSQSGSGNATLALNGSGSTTLKAANTFSGSTFINNGTLRAGISGALPNSAVSLGDTTGSAGAALNLDGGLTWNGQGITIRSGSSGTKVIANTSGTSGTATYNNNITLNSSVTLFANSSGNISLSGSSIDLQGNTLTVDGAGNTTNSAVLGNSTGSGKLTKNGSGILTLTGSANNTYTGLTTVNAGTLSLGMSTTGLNAVGGDLTISGGTVKYASGSADNQIPDSANVTLTSGVLDFSARTETLGQTTPSAAGSFTMNGGTVIITATTITVNRNPKITAGNVNITGTGNFQVGQDLAFDGGTIDFSSTSTSTAHRINLRGGDGTGITYESSGTAGALISNSGGGNAGVSLNGSATTVFTIADAASVATELEIDVPMTGSGNASIRKEGAGKLLLTAGNTYSGTTTINGGTLALGSAGSISNSTSVAISAAATFDVSAISAFFLSGSTSLSASGTGTTIGTSAAAIKGAVSGTVNLGSQPITLTYDGAHPSLYISQGTLVLSGNALTVNKASPLAAGTYTIVQQASGNISTSGSFTVNGTAIGSGKTGSISVSGGNINLIIMENTTTACSRSTGTSSQTYGAPLTFTATLAGNGTTPTGNVVFKDGSTVLSTVALSAGTASYTSYTDLKVAGSPHSIAAYYQGDSTHNISDSSGNALSQTINAKALTVSGLTASSKVYDATTIASLGGAAAFQAAEAPGTGTTTDGKPYNVDSVSTGGTASGVFPNANVGTAKSVTVNGVMVTGTGSGNYTVTQQSGLTANISSKSLTAAGTLAASNKCYDGTTTATLTGSAALQTAEAPGTGSSTDGSPYTGDPVSLSGSPSGSFVSAGPGTGIAVSVSGLFLANNTPGNYTLTSPSLSANINSATASAAAYTETKDMPFKIAETDLMTHASGTGGATLNSIASTSANGVALARDSGWIFYNGNLAGNDSFSYTVHSVTGGCSASGTVSITAVTTGGIAQSISYSADGVDVDFAGIPSFAYEIQRSADGSFSTYTTLAATNAPDGGLFRYHDNSPLNPQGYYRTMHP
jgi:autotransporter-associated beta strand protein